LIRFILVRRTNNITNDKTIPSSVTIEAFITSLLSTLTCFDPYRPSSEGTSILLETNITLGVLIFGLVEQDLPRQEKRKNKGHGPVRLKNFNLTKKF
jgi:hypothetical protein